MTIEEQLITNKMKRINKQVFCITATLMSHNEENISSPKCPRCSFNKIQIHAEKNYVSLTCHKCFWQEVYMRLEKNHDTTKC